MELKYFRFVLATILVTGSFGVARATTITFDTGPISGPSYTQDGVTFTPVGGGSLTNTDFGPDPNGTNGLVAFDVAAGVFDPIRADIAGGTSSVSIDLGDFGGDADLLFLQIYNSSNTKLGEIDIPFAAGLVGMKTLALSNPGIAYAIFGSFSPPSLDGSSVYADNFTLVPEPMTLALFGVGLARLGAMRRRHPARNDT